MPRDDTSSDLRRWVETWRGAGPALDDVKRSELSRLVTRDALRQLADAFDDALRHSTPSRSSGLIEQQAIFQRLRR